MYDDINIIHQHKGGEIYILPTSRNPLKTIGKLFKEHCEMEWEFSSLKTFNVSWSEVGIYSDNTLSVEYSTPENTWSGVHSGKIRSYTLKIISEIHSAPNSSTLYKH